MKSEDIIKWIWFSICAVPGSPFAGRLLYYTQGDYYENYNIEEIYRHDYTEDDFEKRVPDHVIEALSDKNLSYARSIFVYCEEHDITVVPINDRRYPPKLRAIYNPPALLYYKGIIPVFGDSVLIGVVGTRECTDYGRECTLTLCDGLARSGIIVVSGMALGIDGIAATATLNANGFTVAVLGCGIDVVYPPENEALYSQIRRRGLLVSEYPPLARPNKFTFPERNRIISGMSDGVLVIEAGKYSGALITAEDALYQGRNIYAVPGPIDAPKSHGTNELIQYGAKLITDANDIIVEHQYDGAHPLIPVMKRDLERLAKEKKKRKVEKQAKTAPTVKPVKEKQKKEVLLSDDEGKVFNMLSEQPIAVDELAKACSIPTHKISVILMRLSIKGLTEELPGNRYIRTQKG